MAQDSIRRASKRYQDLSRSAREWPHSLPKNAPKTPKSVPPMHLTAMILAEDPTMRGCEYRKAGGTNEGRLPTGPQNV
eukprot:9477849-Pyramimonas_sp.AAC.1